MHPSQQPITSLNPLTQALITLKQGAAPTTPNGQPTVAGQMLSAMQPQQTQSPGIAGLVQNAAIGAAIQQQQQQEAQQALMRMAQQQQQQQQPAEGLAGLPAGNMGFKEGGIIPTVGYAGGGTTQGVDPFANVEFGRGFVPAPGIAGALPAEPENAEVAEIRRLQAERAALDKQRIPELYQRGVGAIAAANKDLETAQQQALKNRGMDRLISVLAAGARSKYGAGEGYLAFEEAAKKSDALYAQQKQLNAMQLLEQDKLRYANETGSNAAAVSAVNNIATIRDKLADNAQQIRQLAETTRGNDLNAAVRREEIAAANARQQAEIEARALEGKAERESRAGIASRAQARQEERENREQFKLALSATKIADRIKNLAAMQYNPKFKADYDAALKELDALAKEYNVPSNFARIMANVGGDAPASPGAPAAPGARKKLVYNSATGKVE